MKPTTTVISAIPVPMIETTIVLVSLIVSSRYHVPSGFPVGPETERRHGDEQRARCQSAFGGQVDLIARIRLGPRRSGERSK